MLFPTLAADIQGKRTLEIGCGDGSKVKRFTDCGSKAVGIDLNCDPLVPGTLKGDFMSYHLTGPFDYIFAFGVFEDCAIYADHVLNRSPEDIELKRVNTPKKMLARLAGLLSERGACLFQTYVDKLIFSSELARRSGFELKSYSRTISTGRHGNACENIFGSGVIIIDGKKYDVVLSPEKYHILYKRKTGRP